MQQRGMKQARTAAAHTSTSHVSMQPPTVGEAVGHGPRLLAGAGECAAAGAAAGSVGVAERRIADGAGLDGRRDGGLARPGAGGLAAVPVAGGDCLAAEAPSNGGEVVARGGDRRRLGRRLGRRSRCGSLLPIRQALPVPAHAEVGRRKLGPGMTGKTPRPACSPRSCPPS